MTSAGNIKLGVEIDANDLSAKLGEAVRKAIAPALAQVQRELNKVQREYDQTARASEKSSTAQAAGAKAVAEAVERVGNEQTTAARKATAAGAITTRQINAITRALDKQTAAWAANTAARSANAAAPTGGPPTGGAGGGGPGGGGGDPVGKHRGGFMQGGKGRFGFLTSPLGMNAVALGIGSLGPALAVVTDLVGGVQQLAQAGLALPGIYGAAGASIGVAVLGFKGMGDAVKAFNEVAKSSPEDLQKNMDKLAEATKNLDPATVAVAKTVSGLVNGPLTDLQKATAGRMLAGFDTDLQGLADKALPRLSGGIGKVADSWNGTLKALTGSLGQDRNLGLMDRILGNTAEGQARMNKAIDPLVHAVATLVAGGTDVLPRLMDGLASGAERFDKWITKVDGDGRLNKWINDGITGVHQLVESAMNLVKVITDITKASGSDQGGFLKWLSEATDKLHDLTSSAAGQSAMREFFRDAREMGKEWLPILVNIGKMLIEVYEASRTWSNILLPFLRVASDLLTAMPGLVTAIGVALLAWKTASIFKPILSGLDSMIGKLGTVASTADLALGNTQRGGRGIAGRLSGAQRGVQKLGGARGTMGLGGIAAGSALEATSDSGAGQIAGALTTVASGALAGSVFGPVGTAVGAGVGAAIAGVTFLLSENAKANETAAAAAEKMAAANERSHEAFLAMEQATKAATDALIESKGAFDPAAIAAVGEVINAIPEKLAGTLPEETVKKIAEAMGNLGMNTDQLATTVTGSGPQFDALIGRLQGMGEPGRILAEQLNRVRTEMGGVASDAAVAAPLLQTLADTGFGTVSQAAVGVANAFGAIPSDVPINVSAPGGQAVFDILTQLGQQVHIDNNKNIIVDAPLAPAVLEQLKALGHEVIINNDKTITVRMDQSTYIDTMAKLGDLGAAYRQLFDQGMGLPAPPVPPQPQNITDLMLPPRPPGGADGMVIPGYAPGHDIVNAVLAPGEGVLIPEAVRGIGGPAGVYNLNSRFRRGLSTRFYADGGVNPDGTPITPGPLPGPETELGVLIQIRDLLAGKGGTSNPIAATAANTATTATAATNGTTGQKLGPFGTPIKPHNAAYDAAAAAISALGGDPEKFLGADPATLTTAQGGMLPVASGIPGAAPGTGIDFNTVAAQLSKFAISGDLADVAGLGLNANSPVITAITSARNKKNGMADQDISGLVTQIIGGAGYSGTLDSTNTSIIKSLTSFHDQLVKKGAVPGAAPGRGTATTAGTTGVPMTQLPVGAMDPVSAFAATHSGGQYDWGASDLADGLSDCSGAVSDLVEIITKGQPDAGRLFSTADAQQVLSGLGAVQGAVPGALQVGWDSGHMRATLPNGVAFESGGGTGQGATYGGNAKGAAGMPNIMSLPINGVMPAGYTAGGATGLPGAAGGSGTPVYVTNWPGGGGGLGALIGGKMAGAGLDAAGQVAGNVSGDVLGAIGSIGNEEWNKASKFATLSTLAHEQNPMALAKALGLDIPDFTRQGGAAGDLTTNGGPGYDASGRLFSDTAGLIDRTFTSLNAQLQAMREQMVSVIEQTNQKLQESALEPIVKSGVQSALEGLKDAVSTQIGTALGNAAAPPIADAVAGAVANLPIDNSGAGGGNLADPAALTGALFAAGGPVYGGLPGKDSVPALLMPGEHVFTSKEVAKLGGHAGVEAFRAGLMKGTVRRFATGGGVIGNDTVGAEFFGVSEVPIISTIVNLLVRVLLKVIGVEIEVRDTLNEMTDDFRGFRGDAFKAFDAQGRLLNDTSGLIERSSTSAETAAEERIRILKIVIQAIIKYLIEKVIVPIAKAVANSAIQAGASAAGAATNTGAPGAGGIVSSLISSAGSAGVDIAAEVGTDFALAISETLIDVVAEGLQSQFPDLATGIFSGAGLATLMDPIGAMLGAFLGIFTGLIGGGALGGASTMIPGDSLFGGLTGGLFDDGGMAKGQGYLPKASVGDELVLSPIETDMFGRLVTALERGGYSRGGNKTVHAPITVLGGGPETATQVQNRLIKHLS